MRQRKYKPPKRLPVPPPPDRWTDLNSAAASEIEQLPGVSAHIAEAIVARRPFRGWDDLRGVPGVSEGLIKQLRAFGARIAPVARQAGE